MLMLTARVVKLRIRAYPRKFQKVHFRKNENFLKISKLKFREFLEKRKKVFLIRHFYNSDYSLNGRTNNLATGFKQGIKNGKRNDEIKAYQNKLRQHRYKAGGLNN